MEEGGRSSKRVRQACLNCRRKKTRCSGEMPVCSFCARLNQPCEWNSIRGPAYSLWDSATTSNPALATRVALIEAKLGMLDTWKPVDDDDVLFQCDDDFDLATSSNSDNVIINPNPDPAMTFSQPPAKDVLARLVDVYFSHCHNQPYVYFHESKFRQRLADDGLPGSLLYAVAATACRFSEDPPYRDRQQEAIVAYANAAWAQIFQQSFSYENDLDIHLVQAMNMLAVIDFTAGHPRHGWVKVALSVRFAQELRLNEEPDDQLPPWEREERRRTFWSMYLLDRLISLGPNRPPMFSDSDCELRLPCPDESFTGGLDVPRMPILETVVDDPTVLHLQNLDHFALTLLMASTLGRFVRYSLKRSLAGQKHALWDSRSPYYGIHSTLQQVESYMPLTYASLEEVLSQNQITAGQRQRAGHLVFSQALFHLSHCLLSHPFILYHHFQKTPGLVPPDFAREALERSLRHAGRLLDLLHDGQRCGRLTETSFYGYCAVVTGVIFGLYQYSPDQVVASTSRERVKAAIDYLDRRPLRWASHQHMSAVLKGFEPCAEMASHLIDPMLLAKKTKVESEDNLLALIDYSRMQRRPESRTPQACMAWAADSVSADSFSNPELTLASHGLDRQTLLSGPLLGQLDPFQRQNLQSYLGDDMGDLWAQVFSDS